jgi:hypothetical protein
MLGAYQQFDATVSALFIEQLKKIRFPVTDVNQPCPRQLGRQCDQVAVMFQPDKVKSLPS